MDCVFCKIVSGKINTRKVYETEKSLSFLDAFPLTKGHTLVIPKKHYSKIQEMDKADNADLFEAVRIITSKLESVFAASLVAVHNGKESGQEIPHVHVHIIPRNAGDGAGPVHNMFSNRPKLDDGELDELVRTINEK